MKPRTAWPALANTFSESIMASAPGQSAGRNTKTIRGPGGHSESREMLSIVTAAEIGESSDPHLCLYTTADHNIIDAANSKEFRIRGVNALDHAIRLTRRIYRAVRRMFRKTIYSSGLITFVYATTVFDFVHRPYEFHAVHVSHLSHSYLVPHVHPSGSSEGSA